MDFKPKNDVLTVICDECGKKKAADESEHGQSICHCQPVASNVIQLKAVSASKTDLPPLPSKTEKNNAGKAESQSGSKGLFGSDYRVIEELGTGSLTKAYKATRRDDSDLLVIKVLREEFGDNPRTVKRFRLEAERACNLNHPNVASVYAVGTTDSGLPFIVTDYLEGINIDEYLKKEGFFSEQEAIEVFMQVCDGLRDAHKKGLIHRDLKPKNIILKKTGKDSYLAKVADFGIAKVLPNPGRETKYLTPDGDAFGDAQYMSPEQCMGKRLDARSDIYALGCLMYQCISGKPPFTSSNAMRLALKQLNELPPRLSERFVDLDISPGIEHVIMRALEKDPDDRYQSVAEMCKDLALVKQGRTPRPVAKKAPPSVPPKEAVQANAAAPAFQLPSINPLEIVAGVFAALAKSFAQIGPGPKMLIGVATCFTCLLVLSLAVDMVNSSNQAQQGRHPYTDPDFSSTLPVSPVVAVHRVDDDFADSFNRWKPVESAKTQITNKRGHVLWASDLPLAEALQEAVAHDCDLTDVNLNGAQLQGSNLSGARLTGASLRNANLFGANLTKSLIVDCDLSSANIKNANLRDAIVSRCQFTGAELEGALMSGSIWNGNYNAGRELASKASYVVKGRFPNLTLDDRNNSHLRKITLKGLAAPFSCRASSVSEAVSIAANKGVDLQGINLAGTVLTNLHLHNADLLNADLRGAYLLNCTFSGCNLDYASLQGATEKLGNLRGASMKGANTDGFETVENDDSTKGVLLNRWLRRVRG